MDLILELLRKQPIIAFFLVIWVIGLVTNALKAKQKAGERREAATRPTPVQRDEPSGSATGGIAGRAVGGDKPGATVSSLGTGQRKQLEQQRQAPASMRGRDRQVIPTPKAAPVAQPAAKSPEAVAREMRRILGLDPEPAAPAPTPQRSAPPPMRREPQVVEPASAGLREGPSRAQEHVSSRIDPHVGESLRDRHMAASKVGQTKAPPSARGEIGSLGGRTKARKNRQPKTQPTARRFAMTDMRRIIVMNEILSPPVAMRDSDRLF